MILFSKIWRRRKQNNKQSKDLDDLVSLRDAGGLPNVARQLLTVRVSRTWRRKWRNRRRLWCCRTRRCGTSARTAVYCTRPMGRACARQALRAATARRTCATDTAWRARARWTARRAGRSAGARSWRPTWATGASRWIPRSFGTRGASARPVTRTARASSSRPCWPNNCATSIASTPLPTPSTGLSAGD